MGGDARGRVGRAADGRVRPRGRVAPTRRGGCLPETRAGLSVRGAREQRELRRELLISPLPGARARRDGRARTTRSRSSWSRTASCVELDGRPRADFDVIDRFIAAARDRPRRRRRGRWRSATTRSRAGSSTSTCPREELVRLSRGLTPARLARVAGMLDPVELMFALKKLRARRAPGEPGARHEPEGEPGAARRRRRRGGRARLRRGRDDRRRLALRAAERDRDPRRLADGPPRRDDPVRGRGAAQPRARDPRPRHLRRDAVGLRHRAGLRRRRRHALVEGVPRLGLRVARREGALHLRRRLRGADGPRAGATRCSTSRRAASPSCAPPARRESRTARSRASRSCSRCPAARARSSAENVLAAWLDLEVASGNDAIASHSEIRKTAKLMGQFLPGTDFVTSGYSVMPRYDNMFGGGNYDADDLDEWMTSSATGRSTPGSSRSPRTTVARGARARGAGGPGRVRRPRLPARDRRRGRRGGRTATTSRDLPDRDRAADVEAADRCSSGAYPALDVARALDAARLRATSPRRWSACSASASRPTTSRPRP